MSWGLPESASSLASGIDSIYYLILGITGAIFVIVELALVYYMVKYRAREGRRAEFIEGSTTAEVIWTAIPAVILVALALLSNRVWSQIKDPEHFPKDALQLKVEAKQFEWLVTYAGPDGTMGTSDDFTKRNQLHLPVDRPVVATLTSQDVIHSFFVPAFRIKQDAVPGMEIPVWFDATETGEFELACAELCGLGHYRMRASVTVHTQEEYQRWLEAEGGDEGAGG